jgi:hypothetical protein
VLNIAFEKRVFVRLSADGWSTHTDTPAVYQSSPSRLVDTFRFTVELPATDRVRSDQSTKKDDARLEFCVCLEANEAEHWVSL